MSNLRFKSRYGEDRELDEIEKGVYTFKGFKKLNYMRIGENPDGEGFSFIDPDGGPMLAIGSKLTNSLKISKIIFDDGRYKIFTEEFSEGNNNEESQDSTGNDKESIND